MPNNNSSVRLSKTNELTIHSPEGELTVSLSRMAAQCLAAGLQRGAGVFSDQKTAHLARFSGFLGCELVTKKTTSKSVRILKRGVELY